MKKLNTAPISGMQELLPKEQAVFNNYKEIIRGVYKHHGFLEIETPTIDRAEILFAKAGGETEKQIYKVIKTDEAASDADQALRFDHTVPLARYVAEHESNLTFPFKVTQIGRNFRGERAQKGRFRAPFTRHIRDFFIVRRNDHSRSQLRLQSCSNTIRNQRITGKILNIFSRDSLGTATGRNDCQHFGLFYHAVHPPSTTKLEPVM